MCEQCVYPKCFWQFKSFAVLAYLVSIVESKTFFVPSSQSIGTIGNGAYVDPLVQQVDDKFPISEFAESAIIPSIQSSDLGLYSQPMKKKRKFVDNYNIGFPMKDKYVFIKNGLVTSFVQKND